VYGVSTSRTVESSVTVSFREEKPSRYGGVNNGCGSVIDPFTLFENVQSNVGARPSNPYDNDPSRTSTSTFSPHTVPISDGADKTATGETTTGLTTIDNADDETDGDTDKDRDRETDCDVDGDEDIDDDADIDAEADDDAESDADAE
jgi:hypothetical protein